MVPLNYISPLTKEIKSVYVFMSGQYNFILETWHLLKSVFASWHFILAPHAIKLDVKSNSDYKVKVLTVSFNLSVFNPLKMNSETTAAILIHRPRF